MLIARSPPKISDQVLINDMEILFPLSLIASERLTLFARVLKKCRALCCWFCVLHTKVKILAKDVESILEKLSHVTERYADMRGKKSCSVGSSDL